MRFKGLLLLIAVLALAAAAFAAEQQPGNIDIRSTLVGARVYLDDTYVGDADLFLEDVPPGDHMILMRQGGQRIVTQFSLRPGEMLMLEGRFEESRIVDLKQIAREEAERRAAEERKAEAERKAAAEAEKSKKPVTAKAEPKKAEPKKAEPKKPVVAAVKTGKSPEEERRELHLNIIRVDFEESGATDIKITPKVNQKVVTNFSDSKASGGKLIRSKQNYLLCDGEGCYRDWTGRFFYIDDAGKRDAFLIRWKETVFTGITPAGTSKREMDLCLNGDCKRIALAGDSVQGNIERYVLSWNKGAFIVRRADILKEISDAGGKVPEF
jgi:hypothetical protein